MLPFLLVPISLFGVNAGLWQSMGVAFVFGLFCCATAWLVLLRPGVSLIAIPPYAYAYIPFLLFASISIISAPSIRLAVFGSGFEFGTIGSLVLLAAVVAAATVASDAAVTLFLYVLEGVGVVVASAVFLLYIGSGSAVALGDIWPQTSLILSAAALIAASLSDRAERRVSQLVHGVFTLLTFFGFLMLFQIGAAVASSIVAATTIVYYTWSRQYVTPVRFPFARSTILLIILAVFLFGVRTPLIEVQPAVRPSLLAAGYITSFEYIDSLQYALIGAGPNSFSYVWNAYRPIEMNASSQSNIVPATSYSTATDVALLFGSLGLLALLLYPLLVAGFQYIRRDTSHGWSDRAHLSEASLVLGIFLYLGMFVYPMGLPLLVVGGAAFGFFCRQSTEGIARQGITTFGRVLFALVAACIGIGFVWIAGLQFSAASDHARAQARSVPDAAAVSLLERAAHTWPIGPYVRDASRGLLTLTFTTVKAQQAAGHIDVEALKSAAERISAEADVSVKLDARNADTWLASALSYASLTTVGFADGENLTKHSFQMARILAPTRPDIPYLEAQFFVILGDIPSARTQLEAALTLKPDYADAQKLLQDVNSLSANPR